MARINGEIIIAAPGEQVFDMVADERNEPRYNPRVARAEKTSHGPVGRGTRFTAQPMGTGAAGVMTVEILDYDRPRGWRPRSGRPTWTSWEPSPSTRPMAARGCAGPGI